MKYLLSGMLTSIIFAASLTQLAAAPPNVMVILSDDQGWGDLSLHGNADLCTPNIDSLARDGAAFDRFFVCPVCSPTRAEFLTGRYHPHGGVFSTSAGGERLDLDETTIAETFKAAGYATAAFGKWHNGMQHPYHPNSRGFDEYYGFCSGHWGHYFSPMLDHNGELVRGKGFVIDDFTDHAMAFAEENRDKPFFCYLAYNTPHSPMQVPDRFYAKFEGAELTMDGNRGTKNILHTRAALAMCENIDWNVGRILEKLDELKIAENTIVVYFSDNGPNGARYNGGMKGRKGSTDEGGVRVPCLVRWPARIKPGTRIPQIAAAIDLLPTLSDMAGIKTISDKPLDGISVRALLEGTAGDAVADRMIFHFWRGKLSVRTQQYRLDNRGKLFDMVKDPVQQQPVNQQHPDVARRLSAAAEKWQSEVAAELSQEPRPFLVGHPATTVTWLPARDGVAHGDVHRSNRYPNCSYFTGWTKTSDMITWDIEVLTPGRYQAELWYTCPQDSVGATVQLAFDDAKTGAKITEAHDPPAIGAKEDRSPRTESYVKDFRPMPLGTLDLVGGRGELTLTATDIPGPTVAEVRYIKLTRLGE